MTVKINDKAFDYLVIVDFYSFSDETLKNIFSELQLCICPVK
jgi:hypothetical protein